jgi:hypothetical protein
MAKKYIDDVNHGYDYDSTIDAPYFAEDRSNFELTIILRIYMEQLNPPKGKRTFRAPDHNGNLWPALRWTNADWIRFKALYIQQVLKVWDKAFLLIPPASFDGFVWPEGGRRRNVVCRLRVKIQDEYKGAHAGIRVVRLANPTKSFFRSNSSLYDSSDVHSSRSSWPKEGATFEHNSAAHELGHLLGLWDIGVGDQQCMDHPESYACYGSNLYERMNVMGGGAMLDLANAKPWLDRIPLHATDTRKSDWKVDWASTEAQLRGLDDFKVDEKFKKPSPPPPRPGIIDL